jgi:hypothetical protein
MNSDVKCIKITAEKDIIHERKFFDRHSKNLENLGDLENNMESHGAPEKKSGLGAGIAPLNFFGRTSLSKGLYVAMILQLETYL